MDDELRFHLEARTDDLMARRLLSREDAHRQSLLEFGGVQKNREAVREARGLRIADEVGGDVRYARWRAGYRELSPTCSTSSDMRFICCAMPYPCRVP